LLELCAWAPSIRKGAPSTIRAWRPSFFTICGKSAAAAPAAAIKKLMEVTSWRAVCFIWSKPFVI
jgi:hypothetical protein